MIIDCEECKARFRLDLRLTNGYRAVRVRCRKCGIPIFAMVPQPAPAASLPYRAERRRGMRAIPSAATAQPLVEEAFLEEATPGNLVDMRRFRETYRKRMPTDAYDISGIISTEIPDPELPFVGAGPEARGNETLGKIAPANAGMRITPAMAPVPSELEGNFLREEQTPGGYKILEETFRLEEDPPPRRSAAFSILKFMLLVAAVGIAIEYICFYVLLPILSWILK
jgi:predicted Zn finger-like uncharacterized protein